MKSDGVPRGGRVWMRWAFLAALGAGLVPLWSAPARADHSLGRACLSCHALRSTKVVSGTRNILSDQLAFDLYQAEWYCGAGTFVGGDPLDCSYCHSTLATEFGDPGNRSSHPVYVAGQTGPAPSPRIFCNDCHNADVEPESLCTKGPGDGYPNHLNILGSTPPGYDPGTNRRIGDAAHLEAAYGPAAAVNWTGAVSEVLCMNQCHNGAAGKGPDILTDYSATNGGHNIVSVDSSPTTGTLDKKLPCYNCHDPHASTDNDKLIISARADGHPNNPFETSYVDHAPPANYDGTNADPASRNDRVVCLSCHAGTGTVEGVSPPSILTGWIPTIYPWHERAHLTVDGAIEDNVGATATNPNNPGGNCLASSTGCHQVHNTDVSDCDSCHEEVQAPLGMKYGGHQNLAGPTACDDCHGFPPVDQDVTKLIDAATAVRPWERYEDYENHTGADGQGGGGAHRPHVNLFWKMFEPTFDPTADSGASADAGVNSSTGDPMKVFRIAGAVCGPCHGDDPGRRDLAPWHNESSISTPGQVIVANVDIRTRREKINDQETPLGYHWGVGAYYQNDDTTQGMSDYGDSISRHGGHVDPTEPQNCALLDCHGKPDPTKPADPRAHTPEVLNWQDTDEDGTPYPVDGSGKYQVSKKTVMCKWCHDSTPAQVVVRDLDGNQIYNSSDSDNSSSTPDDPLLPGVVEAYFKPPSGYSRGGHGDAHINTTDDPSFVDSAPASSAPLECTACHIDQTADFADTTPNTDNHAGMLHFPPDDASNVHRLLMAVLESPDDANGLCTRCHTAYNDKAPNGNPLHHPSGVAFTRAYSEPTGVNYDVPTGGEGDVDEFVMYWSDTTYTAVGNPSQVDLPRLDDIFPGQAQELACTTCHQPHGTDLAVDVGSGGGGTYTEIPDNNMLRLRDTDNTLCNACH